jgi:TolB-like protein/tetratricopeptide (TPR) repeat protein
VPQILGIYLAIGWGTLEFVDWLIGRFALSTLLADLSLVAWATMIPSVLLVAYFHGERGSQSWTRVEKTLVPANLLIAIALATSTMSRGGLGPDPAIVAAALDPTRIAVLYFDDESETQDLGHLASAFTGALIDELTQVSALDVVPRGSVKPYRDASVSMDIIVNAIAMGTLVEGSVSGNRERISLSAALIDPATQSTIESFTLDGPVEEWQDLREELAVEVANRLRRRLGVEVQLRERRAATGSAEALALVERGEQLREEAEQLEMAGDIEAARRALLRGDSLLERAESLDPAWVEPIVLRGWLAFDESNLENPTTDAFDREALIEALAHSERALQLAPDDAGALELHGSLLFRMSEAQEASDPTELLERAERDLSAAVAADPFRAHAWSTLSDLRRMGTRFAEARRDAERALEADPFLSEADVIVYRLFTTSLDLMDIDESMRWCDEGHRRFPDRDYFVACSLAIYSLSEGPVPEVGTLWALHDTLQRLSTPQAREQRRIVGAAWVAAALARAGYPDSARSVVERARADASGGLAPWIDYYAANVYLQAGDRDRALDLLGAFLAAIPQRKSYVASDWTFKEIWEDPRFQELVSAEAQ